MLKIFPVSAVLIDEDLYCRLHEIGKGSGFQVPIDVKSEDNMDTDGNSPSSKQPHCSFCGHPGNKRDHSKSSCEFCVADDNEGCLKKAEGFKCDCNSCGMV